MENRDKSVKVKNVTSGQVIIVLPHINYKQTWDRQDVVRSMTLGVLEECMQDNGAEYMFREGILYIDDLGVKQELGLEPSILDENDDETVLEPVNVIELDSKRMTELLTSASLEELEEVFEVISYEQKRLIPEFAIKHKLIDLDRNNIIKKYTDIDVFNAIRLDDQAVTK